MTPMVPDPVAAWNERVKLFAGFVNAVGLGLIGFSILKPVTDNIANLTSATMSWGLVGPAMHSGSHYILGYIRKGGPSA
jgi:hypothetical protein